MKPTNLIRTVILLAAATSIAFAAACSDDPESATSIGASAGEAVPGPGNAAPGTAASLPRNGAPKVAHPLRDTTHWESAPCEVLTKTQLAQVDFDPYRVTPTKEGGGPGCDYDQLSVIAAYTTIGTQLPDGLSGLYAEKTNFALFEPTDPLKGHPAVIADTQDQRKKGRCAVFVGLRDDLTYRTIVEADPKTRQGKNPCKFAADLTVLALHTMQDGRP